MKEIAVEKHKLKMCYSRGHYHRIKRHKVTERCVFLLKINQFRFAKK